MPELPVVIAVDKKFLQKMDKTTFVYIKDIEHQMQDLKNQVQTAKVISALLRSDLEYVVSALVKYYEACKASHGGDSARCPICAEVDSWDTGFFGLTGSNGD